MKPTSQQKAFQERLGHAFADHALLVRALTHASAVTDPGASNERMEFLGDRVLGLVIAEALLSEDRAAAEGLIAPRFNALVRKETCADVARQIEMGDVLRLGKSEAMSGGRRKEALLGDAMEAVIAALYLDGGLELARERILALWGERIDDVEDDARDPKTALQEWAQARGDPPPSYETVGRKGPDHAPLFTIRVTLKGGQSAEADATSKRAAEQAAAAALLEEIENG